MAAPLLLALDIGTLEARAGLFTEHGALVATGSAPFHLLRPRANHAAYRSAEIWHAIGTAIRTALAAAPDLGARVVGIGVDATASHVLAHDGPPPLDAEADVIAWLDHRAEAEAAEISATGNPWLDHTGGAVSPENPIPKLLWLKRHAPGWERVTAVRDLACDIVRRLTGDDRHGLAPLTAKWPYHPGADDPWRHDLLEAVGLEEIWTLGSLSGDPIPPGVAQGALLPDLALSLGLPPLIPVASGLIDAQAGLLGVIGRNPESRIGTTATLIGGTSSCLMALHREPHAIPGIWGPFRDAILPGQHLTEAGQSWAGAALDALLEHHPGGPRLADAAMHEDTCRAILERLEAEGPAFAAGRHLVPDWLGNRAPLNDGALRALDTGIGAEPGRRAFLESYYATARALVLQTRQIIGHLNAHGFKLERVHLAGGHAKSALLTRLYRDGLGADLVLSDTPEPVLLGTAMAAAAAAGVHPSLAIAADLMAPPQARLAPDPFWRRAHDAAYAIYLRLFAARNDAALAAHDLAALKRPDRAA